METSFIYSDTLAQFDYGTSHPLKTFRLKLTYELIRAYGLLSPPRAKLIEAAKADESALLLFHDRDYIEMLKAVNNGTSVPGEMHFGLGPGDNPVFRGVFDWSLLVTGASIQAASIVESGDSAIAFNISGGLHHAMASRASGFCYVNDPVIAIKSLLKKGRRIAYIDIDAHHGDGVQEAFYSSDQVLTISMHETGNSLFPGTGYEDEIGRDEGRGYSVNIPMPPYSDDELFIFAFNEIIPSLILKFSPDIVVSQLGVDSFHSDPLTHLNYTLNGYCDVVSKIKNLSPKWVALGGGGYDISNVAKAWTLAWAIMNDTTIPERIPDDFIEKYAPFGFKGNYLRETGIREKPPVTAHMRKDVERAVTYISNTVFPLVRVHS